jgi:hypothetical protein
MPVALAWPAPTVSGDCDGWFVTETATDNDWSGTSYWSIDGSGQYARNQVAVNVPDSSDATSRTFTVRWHASDGGVLDTRSSEGVRNLSGCEVPVAGYSLDPTCDGVVVVNTGGLELAVEAGGGAFNATVAVASSVTVPPSVFDVNGETELLITAGDAVLFSDIVSLPSDCEPPNTPVTPAAPTKADPCGTANDTFTIPSTTGVVYKVNGEVKGAGTYAGSGSVTVTAHAIEGYVLEGTSQWTLVFTNEACPPPPPPPTVPGLPETS